jgi:hypothetical protein
MSKFYGLDKFQAGDVVRIANRATLDQFFQSWKLHHPIQPDQLQYAGRVTKVGRSSMYHGGDILYELHDVPGIWHQQLLVAALPENSN